MLEGEKRRLTADHETFQWAYLVEESGPKILWTRKVIDQLLLQENETKRGKLCKWAKRSNECGGTTTALVH